jgi:hypothetical protein
LEFSGEEKDKKKKNPTDNKLLHHHRHKLHQLEKNAMALPTTLWKDIFGCREVLHEVRVRQMLQVSNIFFI